MNEDWRQLVDLRDGVRQSFGKLSTFAEVHDLSLGAVMFFVLVGSLNIRLLDGSQLMFEPVSPSEISASAKMGAKTVSRWCTQLVERGLLKRYKGAYAVTSMPVWYSLAAFLQFRAAPPIAGLTEPGDVSEDVDHSVDDAEQPHRRMPAHREREAPGRA